MQYSVSWCGWLVGRECSAEGSEIQCCVYLVVSHQQNFRSHLAAERPTISVSTCHKENINKVQSCLKNNLQKWVTLNQ